MPRILIVDDEKSIRTTLAAFLRDEGHEVDAAEDFERALDILQASPLDIVLTDIIMPRHSGIELLREVHRINRDIPVIMMTGEPTVETAVEAVKFGAYDYLPKPVDIGALLRCTKRAVAYKQMADEKHRLELAELASKLNLEKLVEERTGKLRQAMINTALVAASMIDLRDPYTAGHQRRVGVLSREIGLRLGMDGVACEGLQLAGFIHDIGKITVPAEILTKPSALSFHEYEIIKGHPRTGYEILHPFEMPWPVEVYVYQHHERMDGSGYPQGISGEAVLPESRILAVADVVEAMMSHRPYRASLGIQVALDEIRAHRGTKYDADVVDACCSLFETQRDTLQALLDQA